MNNFKANTTMQFSLWLRAALSLVTGFTVLIERQALAPQAAR
jgi:hypothetical protein